MVGTMVGTARMTLGFRPFRAAAATTMATSSMPGSTATGGVLRSVAAVLVTVTCSTAIQTSTGATAILASAFLRGVSGMPNERSEGGLTL